jgi:hypothetical protein
MLKEKEEEKVDSSGDWPTAPVFNVVNSSSSLFEYSSKRK